MTLKKLPGNAFLNKIANSQKCLEKYLLIIPEGAVYCVKWRLFVAFDILNNEMKFLGLFTGVLFM